MPSQRSPPTQPSHREELMGDMIIKMQNHIRALEGRLQTSEAELGNAKAQLSKATTEIKNLWTEKEWLEESRHGIFEQCNAVMNENDILKAELIDATEQLATARTEIRIIEEDRQRTGFRLAEASKEIRNLRDERDRLCAEHNSFSNRIRDLGSERLRMVKAANKARSIRDSLIIKLKSLNKLTQSYVGHLELENTELKKAYLALQDKDRKDTRGINLTPSQQIANAKESNIPLRPTDGSFEVPGPQPNHGPRQDGRDRFMERLQRGQDSIKRGSARVEPQILDELHQPRFIDHKPTMAAWRATPTDLPDWTFQDIVKKTK
jgi:uncharacterized coiled-coil DUF342 family protein